VYPAIIAIVSQNLKNVTCFANAVVTGLASPLKLR
jgi:hypothetical protein